MICLWLLRVLQSNVGRYGVNNSQVHSDSPLIDNVCVKYHSFACINGNLLSKAPCGMYISFMHLCCVYRWPYNQNDPKLLFHFEKVLLSRIITQFITLIYIFITFSQKIKKCITNAKYASICNLAVKRNMKKCLCHFNI